ncbi:MAG: WxcM-like domain-containing protein [Bacteroidales bacterium]|nr:WxcM-like domain-containing protein [Candidatus Scybalocola fimicaballi]
MDSLVKIINLPKIEDPRGNLSIIEQAKHIPFEIKRAYWIYDVPGGCDRGGHAYKENQEFVVALSGSFDVELDDGSDKKVYSLNRSYHGLYVPKGMWRTMTNFSTNSLALVLSSTEYDINDYIMDYEEFKRWRNDESYETRPADYAPMPQVKSMFRVKEGVSVFDCSLCRLNKFHDPEGNLTVISEKIHIPFPINRVFYSYDIPGGEDRGAHAHKECHQFIIAASGAFEVLLDDGVNKRTVTLNRPFYGLHVPPGIWAAEQGFSSGSICLVLASHGYEESDYIRNYDDFLKYVEDKT